MPFGALRRALAANRELTTAFGRAWPLLDPAEIVGDRAQARHGFTGSWAQRLQRIGFREVRTAGLTINYRTPQEIMTVAEPVIRAALPDANVPTSVRSTGIPVRHGDRADLDRVVDEWLADHDEGTVCVIGAGEFDPTLGARVDRVRSLTPTLAKGLEFDLVLLVDPESFGDGVEGAVDRYVAMTRATQELVILVAPTRRAVNDEEETRHRVGGGLLAECTSVESLRTLARP